MSSVQRVFPQVEHIVMLMLENRSLDNVLGWLYEGSRPKLNIPPAPGLPSYDGLIEGHYSLPLKPHFWSPVTDYPIVKGAGSDGFTVPNLDPNEGFPNVLNQCFGDATTSVKAEPPQGTFAAMKGFLQDFDADDDTWDETLQITKTYDNLNVLTALARQYAISDRFYCSMPTQTNPNRAFSLCGTSLGRLVNSFTSVEQFNTPTLFNALAKSGIDLGLYFHEIWWSGQCYTQYSFPQINAVPRSQLSIAKIDEPKIGFYDRVADGSLPAFCYIEPKWGYGIGPHSFKQGNDYHPPTNVLPGEKLVSSIFAALARSRLWDRCLFIVTFDEHGGTYDHHHLAWGAVNPGDPHSLAQKDFDFRLYGVRVPTLLISPFVPASTVFRAPAGAQPYDHTSTIATLLKWQGIDPAHAGLWHRVATASTWEDVLRATPVNEAIEVCAPDEELPPTGFEALLDGVPAFVPRLVSERARTLESARGRIEEYRQVVGL